MVSVRGGSSSALRFREGDAAEVAIVVVWGVVLNIVQGNYNRMNVLNTLSYFLIRITVK